MGMRTNQHYPFSFSRCFKSCAKLSALRVLLLVLFLVYILFMSLSVRFAQPTTSDRFENSRNNFFRTTSYYFNKKNVELPPPPPLPFEEEMDKIDEELKSISGPNLDEDMKEFGEVHHSSDTIGSIDQSLDEKEKFSDEEYFAAGEQIDDQQEKSSRARQWASKNHLENDDNIILPSLSENINVETGKQVDQEKHQKGDNQNSLTFDVHRSLEKENNNTVEEEDNDMETASDFEEIFENEGKTNDQDFISNNKETKQEQLEKSPIKLMDHVKQLTSIQSRAQGNNSVDEIAMKIDESGQSDDKILEAGRNGGSLQHEIFKIACLLLGRKIMDNRD